jgi:hypothetical protein
MPDDPREEREVFATLFRLMLSAKGVALACPLCGSPWEGFTDLALPSIQDRPNPDPGPEIVGSVRALLASCQQCGYMAMFDRDVIGGG